MSTIIVIRHAESVSNKLNDYNMFDPGITCEGEVQAEKAKLQMEKYKGEMLILCSPSTRAIQTLEIIFPGEKLYLTHLLRETNTGSPYNKVRSVSTLRSKTSYDLTFMSDFLQTETTTSDCDRRADDLLVLIEGLKSIKKYNIIVLGTHGNFGCSLLHKLGIGRYYMNNAELVVIRDKDEIL